MSGATELLIWGIVVHLVCDWLLQNEWMAANKTERRVPKPRRGDGMITPPRLYWPMPRWWDRHPAAYVHAGIHTVGLALVFGPLPALALGAVHLVIDTRTPVRWWGKLIRQTQPGMPPAVHTVAELTVEPTEDREGKHTYRQVPLMDLGAEVRVWADQVWHITTIAIAALVVGSWS